MDKQLMLGNEAIARGAFEAGVNVAVAYPGTPSTEITEFASEYNEIYTEWAPNEKVALEVGIGAAIGGARVLVAMKHVGVNVAADPLFTVSYTGINGGLVIVVADDPGMHSSQNEQDSRYYAKSAHVPMLEPSDSQEAKEFVKIAFELSEKYDTPVFIRLTTRISHSRSLVSTKDRIRVETKDYKKDAQKNVMMPAMARKRHVIIENRMLEIQEEANTFIFNRVEAVNKNIGIITSGISYQYVKETMPDTAILKLGMVHPLPKQLIKDFAMRYNMLYIVEELEPIIEKEIQSWGIQCIGKKMFSVQGELNANIIEEKIKGIQHNLKNPKKLPVRVPVMCPGCPHRGVYYVLEKLGFHATGDIGCYTLGALPPLEGIDTVVCMGASVGMLHGIEKAKGRDFIRDWVGIIGDSTFIHSGITGLIDIVYNKGMSTLMILDNSTTGMTGHQEHPGTGKTLQGDITYKLNLIELCKSIGINSVQVVDPFKPQDVEQALKTEIEKDEPSVIIVSSPCALLNKSDFVPLTINETVCMKCGACLKIGCPAIQKNNGEIMINDILCKGCQLCAAVCKFNAIER